MPTNSVNVFMDCDPGIDDASALLAAFYSPRIHLVGLSSVSGNVALKYTHKNLLRLVSFCDRTDIPVAKGAAQPLVKAPCYAPEVHGEDGLCGIQLPDSPLSEVPEEAADFIYETALRHPHNLTLLATGPLTNVALALKRHPELADLLTEIVVMGGSHRYGNVTPKAEFNFYVDPQAAQIVFQSPVSVRMVGLDVTLLARLPEDLAEDYAGKNARWQLLHQLLASSERITHDLDGYAYPILHDLTTLIAITAPEAFEFVPCHVEISCADDASLGQSICDFKALENPAGQRTIHTKVALDLDQKAYQQAIMEAFSAM